MIEVEGISKSFGAVRALEGRGIASQLVQAAFDCAQEQGWDVLPVCSYVQAWARRHPEVEPLLAR